MAKVNPASSTKPAIQETQIARTMPLAAVTEAFDVSSDRWAEAS